MDLHREVTNDLRGLNFIVWCDITYLFNVWWYMQSLHHCILGLSSPKNKPCGIH